MEISFAKQIILNKNSRLGGLEVLAQTQRTGQKRTPSKSAHRCTRVSAQDRSARPVTVTSIPSAPRRREYPRRQEFPERRRARPREMTGGGQAMKRIPRIKFPQRRPNPSGNHLGILPSGGFVPLASFCFSFLSSPPSLLASSSFNPVASCPVAIALPSVVGK